MKYSFQKSRLKWKNLLQRFVVEFFKSANNHMASIVITLIGTSAMFILLSNAKLTPTITILKYLPYFALSATGTFILNYLVFRIFYLLPRMIFKIKPKSPIRYLLILLSDTIRDFRWSANFLLVVLTFAIFSTAFSVNKAMIGAELGFNWDTYFSNLDKQILFGNHPHDFFSWVPEYKPILFAYELTYLLWFYIYYLSIASVAASLVPDDVGKQFLLSSVICWFFGGNIIAAFFNSSGPIFVDLHGIESYLLQIDKIRNASPPFGSFALMAKDNLLESFTSHKISLISAFPSMHVASTLLICLLSKEISKLTFRLSVMFFIFIFTGSFVLLWHYLVDAIAGSIIAALSWIVAGKIVRMKIT